MNKLKLFLIVFIGSTVLVSCGGTAKQPATADGFGELEKEIKSEFGDESYFTENGTMESSTRKMDSEF